MPDTPTVAQMVDSNVFSVLRVQDNAAQRGALCLWIIYDHPLDYPHGICARRHEVAGNSSTPTNHMLIGELEFLREVFNAAGLICVGRDPGDDPKIVETWI